ncbi:MAG: hypothetical protein IMY71_10975 [Bacteroidetes bacterium]|nr:hypothetical protein [Bacteroidota bacterium]
MKTILLTLTFALISLQSLSQEHNRISVCYGISDNVIFRKEILDGAGGYEGKGATLFGLRYQRILFKSFSMETGLDYSKNKIRTSPAPGISGIIENKNIEMLSIPIYGNY